MSKRLLSVNNPQMRGIQDKHERLLLNVNQRKNFQINVSAEKMNSIESETAHLFIQNICKDFGIPRVYGFILMDGEFLYTFDWSASGYIISLENGQGILCYHEGKFDVNFGQNRQLNDLTTFDPNSMFPDELSIPGLIFQVLYYYLILKKS